RQRSASRKNQPAERLLLSLPHRIGVLLATSHLRPSTATAPMASGASVENSRIGDTMKAWISTTMFVTLTLCGTTASLAQEPKPAAGVAAADDNMTPYRTLAADTLNAFKAQDMPTARKKARELEVAWDTREKALQK